MDNILQVPPGRYLVIVNIFFPVTGGHYFSFSSRSLVGKSEQTLPGHRWTIVDSFLTVTNRYLTVCPRSPAGNSKHILPGHS